MDDDRCIQAANSSPQARGAQMCRQTDYDDDGDGDDPEGDEFRVCFAARGANANGNEGARVVGDEATPTSAACTNGSLVPLNYAFDFAATFTCGCATTRP